MTKKQVLSIFSGLDALGLGLVDYFDLVLSVELEKHACDTIKANQALYGERHTVWNKSVFEISDGEIEKWKGVTGFIAGPPCQPFSPAKGKFEPSDVRIKGLTEYIRWVRILQPEFFVFENSFGLLQGGKKEIFNFFEKQLIALGYNVQSQILNAHDYGNVQNRKRLIAVGVKNTANWKFEFPKPVKEIDKKFVRDILKENEENGPGVYYSKQREEIVSHVPEGGHWRDLPTEELIKAALGGNYEKREGGMTGVMRRLHRDQPCPTLTTNPCQRNSMLTHPIYNRPLSVNEYKRAQGLPDDYKLISPVRACYTMIGNAVPMELSKAISESIYYQMQQAENLKNVCNYTEGVV